MTREQVTEKKEKAIIPGILGVNIQQGIAMTGGRIEGYLQVLSFFCKDAEDRLPLLQAVPDTDNLPLFVTQVHALKSASASIGASELSEAAAGLEAAGRAGELALVEDRLPGFFAQLSEMIINIRRALESREAEPQASSHNSATASDISFLLGGLAAALKSQNALDIDRLLDELMKRPLDIKTREALELILDEVLMAEYANAMEIIQGIK